MLITTQWMLDYLEPACSHEAIVDTLPKVGLEIEELSELKPGDEIAPGRSPRSHTDGKQYLVELSVLSNRPDCLGMIGIAREIAAFLKLKLRYPLGSPSTGERSGAAPVGVEIREPELCPRYMCQLIRGVKVAPSPNWFKARLQAIGSRPINNVVDVTNFVLYEWGQPLHAFDHRKLKGGRIVVRRMASNESIKLLNGKAVDGRQTPLVIADAERPVALAGIMGGGDAETNEATVDVLLEAACFDPVNIRKTVRSIDLGLEAGGTESSYRFERGTDPNTMLVGALHRASSLIAELSGGHIEGPPSDMYPQKRERRSFSLTTDLASACLGTLVSKDTIRESLRRLEMDCSDDLVVKVPTWRVDVNDPVVLIEDVARHIDYDTIPTKPSATKPTIGIRCTPDRLRQVVVQHLIASGYLESRNPSLESPDAGARLGSHEAGAIALRNPANREMSVARRSLLPGLLKSAERNLRRGTTSVRLFEIDRVFWLEENQPKERWMAAGVAGGAVQEYDWRSGGAKLDFHHLKGTVEGLLDAIAARSRAYRPLDRAPYLAGGAAEIVAGDASVGRVGELVKGLVDTGTMPVRLFAFELELERLTSGFLETPRCQPLARTPSVTRDLAIVVGEDEIFEPINQEIRRSAGTALESLWLVDLYRGPQVPSGRKSLAFHLVFRDPTRTLTADDASTIMDGIVKSLRERFGAELRA